MSRAHILPAQMLLGTLTQKTNNKIVVVGNLTKDEAKLIEVYGAQYIDEDSIDYQGRLPIVNWQEKYRNFGWYKQMFIRLCIDTFIHTDQVVILDSEVFVFDNWDEQRFYEPLTNNPRSFFWVPAKRKSDWDYRMYKGAAYLLSFLPECKGIMEYANSTAYKRHISGVVIFSTKNIAKLWQKLSTQTNLKENIDNLFNNRDDLAFSDHDIYGLSAEYGLFDKTVPTVMHPNLLGWYDNHDDEEFNTFKKGAMWSMCQNYSQYQSPQEYYQYMKKTANHLNQKLPTISEYWNKADRSLIDNSYDRADTRYFFKYQQQLDFTFRKRFLTMYRAISFLNEHKKNPTIVEIGTLRDNTKGGGHSTYKFGEYCFKFGGSLHTVDILEDAIDFSRKATKNYQPWITYHVQDSSEFLNTFNGKIDLLYLDGFDSTPGREKEASIKQLDEIKNALPKLSNECVILLDDADLPEGGKASLSSQFLLSNGFRLEINAYQQLYTRDGLKHVEPRTQKKKLLDKLKSKRG